DHHGGVGSRQQRLAAQDAPDTAKFWCEGDAQPCRIGLQRLHLNSACQHPWRKVVGENGVCRGDRQLGHVPSHELAPLAAWKRPAARRWPIVSSQPAPLHLPGKGGGLECACCPRLLPRQRAPLDVETSWIRAVTSYTPARHVLPLLPKPRWLQPDPNYRCAPSKPEVLNSLPGCNWCS